MSYIRQNKDNDNGESERAAKSNTVAQQFSDQRESALLQLQQQQMMAETPLQRMAEGDEEDELLQGKFVAQREGLEDEEEVLQGKFEPAQRAEKVNETGMPDNLKAGIESLSGFSMDHVRVHYNSDKPAQLNAHAYAQGSEIHLAPGQEKHLPHEAWHVVQQMEGRVRPTMQMKGGVPVNDDVGLEHEADAMGAKALQESGSANSFQVQHATIRSNSPAVQRMINIDKLAKLLTENKKLRDLTDYQKECVLYWNTRGSYDGLIEDKLIEAILRYSSRDFEGERDSDGRLPGQPNPKMALPKFMQEYHEFDLHLPLGIGTLSFRHGHQYVLGTDNNKWISNNVSWVAETESRKFKYLIHVILQFKEKPSGGWEIDPHVTIRNEREQLKQTGVAFISDPNEKTNAKKVYPEMEATKASYSMGLGKNKRKPGENMGVIPDTYVESIFVPWLTYIRDVALPLNKIDDNDVSNRHLWVQMQNFYAGLI